MKTTLALAALPAAVWLAVATAAPDLPGPTGSRSGLLEKNTLFTVYGRGFGVAPILGKLGQYQDIEAMAQDTRKWVEQISAVNDGKGVVTGIHLIYGLGIPCKAKGECLLYLGQDIVEKYIKPAAERGWVVILDTQLGRSDPVEQVNHMIQAGLLKYDNVHVAIDPEFHVVPGHDDPGIPVGHVTASQINQAQEILGRYVESENLKTPKILMVHQFEGFMIADKSALRNNPNVELVVDMDGLGTPLLKTQRYNDVTNDRVCPAIRYRGIKVFFPNRWEHAGHFDKPPMMVDEVFGLHPVPGGVRMATKPDVIIIA